MTFGQSLTTFITKFYQLHLNRGGNPGVIQSQPLWYSTPPHIRADSDGLRY